MTQKNKIVCDEFAKKYGKEYMQQCRAGIPPAGDEVSKKLQKKLSPHAPPKALIENYLVEIAKVLFLFSLKPAKVERVCTDEIVE